MIWHHSRLGDVLTLQRGHDLPNAQRQDGDIPVVSSSGITGYHNEPKASAPGVVTGDGTARSVKCSTSSRITGHSIPHSTSLTSRAIIRGLSLIFSEIFCGTIKATKQQFQESIATFYMK